MVFKKKDALLEALYEIAVNVHESAQFFNQFKIESPESIEIFAKKMKEYELKGDSYIHRLIQALNKTFITTIEREDILNLGITLDDVLDGMEACASRFYMYGIVKSDDVMIHFGEYIEKSTEVIVKALDLLRNKKLQAIREYTITINDYESAADELMRKGIRNLFHGSDDAIHIMKFKDIYEILEGVTDSCEDVADTLETIIMRNS